MWHPKPFVKHPVPATHPPTADEAAASLWFSPLRSGRLELTERTWVPAMVPWRATDDGFVTPEVLAWYERFARGQPGALVVEATGIRDVPSGPFIQIIDFLRIRRRPDPERYFRQFMVLTDRHRALLPGTDNTTREALARLPE